MALDPIDVCLRSILHGFYGSLRELRGLLKNDDPRRARIAAILSHTKHNGDAPMPKPESATLKSDALSALNNAGYAIAFAKNLLPDSLPCSHLDEAFAHLAKLKVIIENATEREAVPKQVIEPKPHQSTPADTQPFMNRSARVNDTAPESLEDVIKTAISQFSSPTYRPRTGPDGGAMMHGGQSGFIVWEHDGVPFICGAIEAHVETMLQRVRDQQKRFANAATAYEKQLKAIAAALGADEDMILTRISFLNERLDRVNDLGNRVVALEKDNRALEIVRDGLESMLNRAGSNFNDMARQRDALAALCEEVSARLAKARDI